VNKPGEHKIQPSPQDRQARGTVARERRNQELSQNFVFTRFSLNQYCTIAFRHLRQDCKYFMHGLAAADHITNLKTTIQFFAQFLPWE